jgi:beta-glucanase (GH16 family)
LRLDERFDRFNQDIWKKGDGAVGSEAMCRFTANGVQVVDGMLELVIRKEQVGASWSDDHQIRKDDYEYSCGELRSRIEKRIRYGRLEARIKAPPRQEASGYIASLFTYRAEGPTPIPDDPTDIMMNFWIPNDRVQDQFGGNKRSNAYPMKTQYDWLRYYELDSHSAENW